MTGPGRVPSASSSEGLVLDGDIVVVAGALPGGYTRIDLLQRFADFEDARAYALAVFHLAFVLDAPTEYVYADHTYQTALVRTSDLTESARGSLVRAVRTVQAHKAVVLSHAEISLVGERAALEVTTATGHDLASVRGAESIGRDFVEAVAADIGGGRRSP